MDEHLTRDFFDIITGITETHYLLHMFGIGHEHYILQGLRNRLCNRWATATNDDILLFVARARIDFGKQETVENMREIRATHQLHLTLGQKH